MSYGGGFFQIGKGNKERATRFYMGNKAILSFFFLVDTFESF
jgi:hypothetical protein